MTEGFGLSPSLSHSPPIDALRDRKDGQKRAPQGADTERDPFSNIELSDIQQYKLNEICHESDRVDIAFGTR